MTPIPKITIRSKGIKMKNRDSCHNMKSWLARTYGNRIVFLITDNNKGQLMMTRDSLDAIERGKK